MTMLRSLVVAVILGLVVPVAGAGCASCEGIDQQVWPVKGGIAIVGDGTFVSVNLPNNHVTIQGKIWTGKPSDQREVVLVYEHQVVEWSKLPERFDLSKAILASFETVRFFDFSKSQGGFYKRAK
jgi:hypothetical protein